MTEDLLMIWEEFEGKFRWLDSKMTLKPTIIDDIVRAFLCEGAKGNKEKSEGVENKYRRK